MLRAVTGALRIAGQGLERFGRSIDSMANVQVVLPSTVAVKYKGIAPNVAQDAVISHTATLVGKVVVGSNSVISFGTILRGDDNNITVGDNVYIAERVMIHCRGGDGDVEAPTVIGNGCVVQTGAILHGCVLEENSVVGKNSQVLDGAKILKGGALAPGSLLAMGKTIPAGQLWGGVPAVFIRTRTPEEIAQAQKVIASELDLSLEVKAAMDRTIEEDEIRDEMRNLAYGVALRTIVHVNTARIKDFNVDGMPYPGRIFNTAVSPRAMHK